MTIGAKLLSNPRFVEAVQLIRRTATVNQYGENVLTEAAPVTIQISAQSESGEILKRFPEAARLSDSFVAYSVTDLAPEAAGKYADVIIYQGRRYLVQSANDWQKWGYTEALCTLEAANV